MSGGEVMGAARKGDGVDAAQTCVQARALRRRRPFSNNTTSIKITPTTITPSTTKQNASTSTVRTAGSSQANPFACVASGIAALWGPAHGGANEAVLRMLAVSGAFPPPWAAASLRRPLGFAPLLLFVWDKGEKRIVSKCGHRAAAK